MSTVIGKKESTIGLLTPDKFILGNFQTGDKAMAQIEAIIRKK